MPISRCNRAGYQLMLGLALLIATWAALTPQPMALPDVPLVDKWAHLLTYLVLAFLLDASWPVSGFDWRKWLFLLGYGLMIELIQSQIPNRFFSIGDLFANAGGIALYALLSLPVLRMLRLR